MPTIYLAYGSESGNAQRLALSLSERLTQNGFTPVQFDELDEIYLKPLSQDDTLLIITSSFGDGEAPSNADEFYEHLQASPSVACQFAVFGLGDVSYPKFCGFSKDVDRVLRERGATAIANRVDADTDYQGFFEQWADALIAHFSGDSTALAALDLQVKAYSEDQSFPARIQSVQRLNSGDFPAYDIDIGIAGSGMHYQAGDLLYVVPPANTTTLARVESFYGTLEPTQRQALGDKELRQLGKPLLRALAKLTKNDELKALTKMSAAKQLADYCYGRDVADVLQDFCSPETVSVDDLLDTLSAQLPRAYSIASCGEQSPNSVKLCVREVAYQLNNQDYVGTASHFLAHCNAGSLVNVYTRSNPHFHLPQDDGAPLIFIGAGVGIAPFMGFLAQKRRGEVHLFFGERQQEHDFLYRDTLENHLQSGHLTALHTVFSRDQAEKIYVQDALRQQAELVWQLLQNGAHIFVCGSKANLAKPIDQALCDIATQHGDMSAEQAQQWLYGLVSNLRYHQDLY